jgi:hypothetical protein
MKMSRFALTRCAALWLLADAAQAPAPAAGDKPKINERQ